MARIKDRHIISEAVRKQSLWRTEDLGANYHVLLTDYDEQLEIYYNDAGNIRFAEYWHWDGNTSDVNTEDPADHQIIKQNKRARVLELINQKDVADA